MFKGRKQQQSKIQSNASVVCRRAAAGHRATLSGFPKHCPTNIKKTTEKDTRLLLMSPPWSPPPLLHPAPPFQRRCRPAAAAVPAWPPAARDLARLSAFCPARHWRRRGGAAAAALIFALARAGATWREVSPRGCGNARRNGAGGPAGALWPPLASSSFFFSFLPSPFSSASTAQWRRKRA